ncbi:MAG: hypothetical protein R6W94_08435 [Spirochaetia bacterium]
MADITENLKQRALVLLDEALEEPTSTIAAHCGHLRLSAGVWSRLWRMRRPL